MEAVGEVFCVSEMDLLVCIENLCEGRNFSDCGLKMR